MSILQIVNWLLLGLSGSVALVLWAVVVIYIGMGDEPSIQDDWKTLLTSTGLFTAFAVIAGFAVMGLRNKTRWRWFGQLAMLACLVAIGLLAESLR